MQSNFKAGESITDDCQDVSDDRLLSMVIAQLTALSRE
jgi:hypothetical protein